MAPVIAGVTIAINYAYKDTCLISKVTKKPRVTMGFFNL